MIGLRFLILQTNYAQIFFQGLLIMYILTIVLLILILVILYNLLIEMRKTREILEKMG